MLLLHICRGMLYIFGLVFTKALSQTLGLNVVALYWTFKPNLCLSPFVNTGPGDFNSRSFLRIFSSQFLHILLPQFDPEYRHDIKWKNILKSMYPICTYYSCAKKHIIRPRSYGNFANMLGYFSPGEFEYLNTLLQWRCFSTTLRQLMSHVRFNPI